MKARHVAALALVGWYLMVPTTDQAIPLSEWQMANRFDRAADCEGSRKVFFDAGMKRMKDARDDAERTFGVLMTKATCIPSDDPRLQKPPK